MIIDIMDLSEGFTAGINAQTSRKIEASAILDTEIDTILLVAQWKNDESYQLYELCRHISFCEIESFKLSCYEQARLVGLSLGRQIEDEKNPQ